MRNNYRKDKSGRATGGGRGMGKAPMSAMQTQPGGAVSPAVMGAIGQIMNGGGQQLPGRVDPGSAMGAGYNPFGQADQPSGPDWSQVQPWQGGPPNFSGMSGQQIDPGHAMSFLPQNPEQAAIPPASPWGPGAYRRGLEARQKTLVDRRKNRKG